LYRLNNLIFFKLHYYIIGGVIVIVIVVMKSSIILDFMQKHCPIDGCMELKNQGCYACSKHCCRGINGRTCHRVKMLESNYCVSCSCDFVNCTNSREPTTFACKEHQCLKCVHTKEIDSTMCKVHKCRILTCSNPSDMGGDFCKELHMKLNEKHRGDDLEHMIACISRKPVQPSKNKKEIRRKKRVDNSTSKLVDLSKRVNNDQQPINKKRPINIFDDSISSKGGERKKPKLV
jgi:hypothetical protein